MNSFIGLLQPLWSWKKASNRLVWSCVVVMMLDKILVNKMGVSENGCNKIG